MKNTLLKFLVVFTTISLFISCSKNSDTTPAPPPPPPPPNTNIDVTGLTSTQLNVGVNKDSTVQLNISLVPANATNKKIIWSSNNSTIATVNANGVVTGLQLGLAIITAKSENNPSAFYTYKIWVLKNYDVYIAGNGASGGYYPGDHLACYWKNETLTPLYGGYDVSRSGRAITVSNNNVYVAGHTIGQYLWNVPTLWVNGAPIILGSQTNGFHHYANSVAVSGSNAYVAGYLWNTSGSNSFRNASLWKVNGNIVTPITLPFGNGLSESEAWGVTTNGTDVYTSGNLKNSFYSLACYWKNSNAPVVLSASTNWAKGKAIATMGSDVYVAGSEGCPNVGCSHTIKLWKNNQNNPVTLETVYGSSELEVTGISISGSDIYVSGYVINADKIYVAKVWKVNGTTVTTIPLTDGTKHSYATSVMASGNDVLVAGHETNLVQGLWIHPSARYWRLINDVLVQTKILSDLKYQLPESGLSRAFGIFIK